MDEICGFADAGESTLKQAPNNKLGTASYGNLVIANEQIVCNYDFPTTAWPQERICFCTPLVPLFLV